MERMNFWKTDQSDHLNGQFLLSFIFSCIMSCSCYQLLTPGNLQSTLTEGDHRHLPVTSHSIFSLCQSKQLDSLGIARWQTVFLLSSMLRLITTMANLSSGFPVFWSFSWSWQPYSLQYTRKPRMAEVRQAFIFSHAYHECPLNRFHRAF